MIRNLKNTFTNYWEYLAIKTACKNEIFDQINEGTNTIIELSRKNNYDKKILDSLILSLQQIDLIFIKNNKLFLTAEGKILTENHSKSLKYACILWAEEHLTAWQNLDFTLKTGNSAFEEIYGEKFFDYISTRPEKLIIYHRAMAEYARDDYENICSIHDFSKHKSIIDVGGGLGVLINNIADNNKNIDCYLFEKQEVISLVREKRINTLVGNFLVEIPKIADAIIMSRVLHDWSDDECSIILKNVYNALLNNGTLYIIENFSDKIEDNASLLSLNMALMTKSYERTKSDFGKLLSHNNFKIIQIKKINNLQWLIICEKINI